MTGSDGKQSFEDLLRTAAGGFAGVKLGPGLIGNLTILATAAVFSIGIVAWSFSASPWAALGVAGMIGLLAFYIVERLVRFAEKNPAAALLASAELYHHLREEAAAKDPKIIIDSRLSDGTPMTIEHQADHGE